MTLLEVTALSADRAGASLSDTVGAAIVLPERVCANARAVAEFAGTLTDVSLRQSFLRALTELQPIPLDYHPNSDKIFLNFGSRLERDAFVTIMAVDTLPENWEYLPEERPKVAKRVVEAIDLINVLDPKLLQSIQTIVGTFLFAKLKYYDGGSLSNIIGAIWIAMQPSRPAVDFAELIVHEYVHQCLFLEDMVHCIFIDGEARMAEPDAQVISAILQISRGYDKAFHSAFVAFILSRFYRKLGNAEKADKYLAPLSITVPMLQNKAQFLSDHGRAVLEEFAACCGLS